MMMTIRKKALKKSALSRIPWNVIIDGMKRIGDWDLVESGLRRKIFEKGTNKIVAVKLGPDRWKAEFFSRGKLMDTSGVSEEEYVKRVILEMGVYRSRG